MQQDQLRESLKSNTKLRNHVSHLEREQKKNESEIESLKERLASVRRRNMQ
jgi:hypothetical protein